MPVQQQLLCNLAIDFSEVIGNRILPFTVELDLGNSVLNPPEGENQRFCYIITGVGSDTSEFADLSHLVLGVCNQITRDQFGEITVTIDGEEQNVIWDTNVELVNPDPSTGCSGLKFNFGLNKVGGVMNICYELTIPRPVGPNPVCLFGGNTTASGLSICGPVCEEAGTCETIGFQTATVCVPVTVTPTATAGATVTTCCGDAVITPGATACPSANRSCRFTVTQRVCIAVPIAFGANTTLGDVSITCETASAGGCANCT